MSEIDSEAGLVARLRATHQVFPAQGGGCIGQKTFTSYVTHDGYRLVNPDGPAAADRIAALESALRECADDLEAELRHRYRGMTFPAALPKYDADMEPVTRARALLADGGDHAR